VKKKGFGRLNFPQKWVKISLLEPILSFLTYLAIHAKRPIIYFKFIASELLDDKLYKFDEVQTSCSSKVCHF
jgi:hypothetical protein